MKILNTVDLEKKINSFIKETISADELSKWAAEMHMQYEKREIVLEKGNEKKLFDLLIDLTYINEKGFETSKDKLEEILKKL